MRRRVIWVRRTEFSTRAAEDFAGKVPINTSFNVAFGVHREDSRDLDYN